MSMEKHTIAIVGAGTAGLTAALYLARAGQDIVVLEKGAPGGKLLTISEISNYPGLPTVPGFQLAQSIYQSATDNGVSVTSANVISIHRDGDNFIVETDNGDFPVLAVIVATGLSNVATTKGEKILLGKGVSYCATCDGPLYRHKDVAIIGQGDKSLTEALYLSNLVNHLYYLTPNATLVGTEVLVDSFKKKANIETLYEAKALEIKGSEHVTSLSFAMKGETKEINVAAVFPLLGEKSASSFLSPLNVKTDKGFILVDNAMMSSEPGLFAAGDIVSKALRQVVTAAGDGANASTGVLAYLRKKGA
jgi:thioredoxin reductase (NADPH)